jgi:peptidoglycan hydrolase-like protein with peptidoglycan-binding domain
VARGQSWAGDDERDPEVEALRERLTVEKLNEDNLIPLVRVAMLFGWTEPDKIPDAYQLSKAFDCLGVEERTLICYRAGVGTEPHNDSQTAQFLGTRPHIVAERLRAASETMLKAIGVINRLTAPTTRHAIREFQAFKLARVLHDTVTNLRDAKTPLPGDGEHLLLVADAALADARQHGYLPEAVAKLPNG